MDQIPDYEPTLEAFHKAFAAELEGMVRSVPIVEGNFVLEMACGDGAYTPWLAQMAGRSGQVVGLDVSKSYLDLAREESNDRSTAARTDFIAASIDRLPFPDGTFDAVWCAQSLFSLADPVKSVRQMTRVVKPGGLVAVLENDTLHQILLPWPVDLELAIRAAEWQALHGESPHPQKFYVGRRLAGVFRQAGVRDLQIRSFATSRIAPLDSAVRKFLECYLQDLGEQVAPHLSRDDKQRFQNLIRPSSGADFLDQADFQMTVIDHVIHGRVSAADPERDDAPR